MLVLAVVAVGVALLVRLWVSRRKGSPGRGPGWRKLTWAILIFNALMLVWIIAGAAATTDNCAGEVGSALDACRSGTAVGASLAVGALVTFTALGDVILGVIWLVTRKPQRTCPVCGSAVAVGVTSCAACGHDFRQVSHPSPPSNRA